MPDTNKDFTDVFPKIVLSDEAKELLEGTMITKVSINKTRDALRVYLTATTWIHKKHIFELERAIREQFFSDTPVSVKVIEKFILSAQYNPRVFMDLYRQSILLELREHSMILANLFAQADLDFTDDDHLTMTIDDSRISQEQVPELTRILEKIFCERCGFHFFLTVKYRNRVTGLRQEDVDRAVERPVPVKQQDSAQRETNEPAAAEEITKNEDRKEAETHKEPAKSQTKPLSKAKTQSGYPRGKRSFNRGRAQVTGETEGVIFGFDFEDDIVPIKSIEGEIGEVAVRGKILSVDDHDIREDRSIITFAVTDGTDSIRAKMFISVDEKKDLLSIIRPGACFKIKGMAVMDSFDKEIELSYLKGICTISDFQEKRVDTCKEKRVELHCHTKMSDMDAVADAGDLVRQAYEWGHKAIAITDHGVVQGFPDAYHAYSKIVPKDSDFKVIYGLEAYLVDDLKGIVTRSKNQPVKGTDYVVFDIETTGISTLQHKITEIGAVRVENGEIVDRFSTFVNPKRPIPYSIEQLTGITDAMVMDAETIDQVLPKFLEFSRGAVMVAHNADFDMGFIQHDCSELGLECPDTYIDTVGMARFLLPNLGKATLNSVAKAMNIPLNGHHRAVNDAECTAQIFVEFLRRLESRGITTLNELNKQGSMSVDRIKKLYSHHAIILAMNETGRVNLYQLVSASHLTYYNRQPKIPKSLLMEHREGLIIGSACVAGEIMDALLNDRPDSEIANLVQFYDYLEVQPIANNRFLIRENKYGIATDEDLRNLNRKVVKLGGQFDKPVVATCDVHFLNPEDEIYRRIIKAGKGYSDVDEPEPIYLRTTDEMLDEFSYLGADKAYEIVVTNTNAIADRCENISPIHPGKFPPVIENSDHDLKEMCFKKAHEMYGDPLPQLVEDRLERELNSIISNGYAVMYIIAQKLVKKSNDDGYLVGSRGSVGSSFVAMMAGITEVNPLPPHYRCHKCKYSDFDSEEVRSFARMSGCDMPDKICPICGEPLAKDGFDIPFETFLGFEGNKEPDIDLNFSGDYQAIAHRYTEVIFGKGQTFKAGTIGTLAEKTAYGYVKHYFEDRGINKRGCEIDRIVKGCTGVRRTTGQHPGGIIVLPHGQDINKFTPVQHPANDMTSDVITTHFDYHSIDGNLLKLDILGHDDPTMIRMLGDLTGIDMQKIPLDDQGVMSLFSSTKALGIQPSDIGGCPLGSLGIPEFGTEFTIQMLQDTKPKQFSDLIRVSGLSHGTDVWLGNAQTVIKEGKATISTAICTRDDIMIYLIGKGVESEQAFTIMESVRKGKGLKPEWEEEMKKHDVPDWYIWSCQKIKYMFPKAHAAAYVMMAYRIAYCKINYPLAFYAAYFSIRASAFSYELMCQGRSKLEYYMNDYNRRKDDLSKKEQDSLKDMKIVQEMYARGFEFMPVDLTVAKAHKFQIIDGRLMPALDTIEGLGDKAADAVEEAAKHGPFLSKDDFRNRTKASKTVIDLMAQLGILGDIPEENQISLFDF